MKTVRVALAVVTMLLGSSLVLAESQDLLMRRDLARRMAERALLGGDANEGYNWKQLADQLQAQIDAARPPKAKQTKLALYVTPREAYEMKQKLGDKALFIDIRTRAEIQFLGMPQSVDAVIPFAELPELPEWDEQKKAFKLEVVNGFTDELRRRLAERGLDKEDVIILQCRSGDRSARAADVLAGLGFTRVYSQVEGFEGDLAAEGPSAGTRSVNGWKNAGLPWDYRLDKRKMPLARNL